MGCTVYTIIRRSYDWGFSHILNMRGMNVHAIAFVVYSMSDLDPRLNVLQAPIADCASWLFLRNVPIPTLFLPLSVR